MHWNMKNNIFPQVFANGTFIPSHMYVLYEASVDMNPAIYTIRGHRVKKNLNVHSK
jgi:hypothetical protein